MNLNTKFKGDHTALRLDAPLSFEQMRSVAPNIFANEQAPKWSEQYGVVPTSEVLRRLAGYGFSAFMVSQSKSRNAAGVERVRHLVRLRHEGFRRPDVINEVVLINSDDAPCSYQLAAGVYRVVSRDTMVCGTPMREATVRSNGDAVKDIIQAVLEVVDDFALIDCERASMEALWLTNASQVAFAKSGRALRWEDPDAQPPVTTEQLLRVERTGDSSADLWTTLSRVHEHLTRGGIRGVRPDGRRAVTRPVHAVDRHMQISRGLWLLARAVLELNVE